MRAIFNRVAKEQTAKYLRKIFHKKQSWLNEDLEVVTLPEDVGKESALDMYPGEWEGYPVIIVKSTSNTLEDLDLQEYFATVSYDEEYGEYPRAYEAFGQGTQLAFKISPEETFRLRKVDLTLSSEKLMGSDILVSLVSGSVGLPGTEVVASGSLSGFARGISSSVPAVYPVELLQEDGTYVPLQIAGDYWLTIGTEPDSRYYLYYDTSVAGHYATKGTGQWISGSSGSVVSTLYGPVCERIGGGAAPSVELACTSKSLDIAEKMAEMTSIYMKLARHADYVRTSATETKLGQQEVSSLKGIGLFVDQVSIGTVSVRVRGNDRIFTIPVVVTFYSNWWEDFDEETLKEFGITITRFT